MAVKIRLRKISDTAKKRYNFRLVVMDERAPRDGRVIEEIGYYDPSKKPASLKVDLKKYEEWRKKGAQVSSTINSLIKKMK
ncbi:MAG: 30S ribosomal protein S16 [Candidatus Omnitrophota bacterium]